MAIRTLIAMTAFWLTSNALVLAGPYDGLYFSVSSEGQRTSCDDGMVSNDGGPTRVDERVVSIPEGQCILSNPIEVRGFSATLFDASCQQEDFGHPLQRLMVMKTREGVTLIWPNGYVQELQSCP